MKQLIEDDKKRYATITCNKDGAALFKSSNCSIWPIWDILLHLARIKKKIVNIYKSLNFFSVASFY